MLKQRLRSSRTRTLKGLGDPWLGEFLPLEDRLVELDPSASVIALDREHLLEEVGRPVGLEGPDLHLSQPLATELGLPP
jgi:hypothetical protein